MTGTGPILVTGAAGKTGLAVTRALVAGGAVVRALAYRPAHEAVVREAGARELVLGDLRDLATLARALRGTRAVYHLCPNLSPDEVEIGRLAIEAAVNAGVERFVFHSVLHPQTEKMPHHWQKMRVEELLFEAPLEWTILQPTAYMQNLLGRRREILAEGLYRVPYPVETRLSLIDLSDLAAAATRVLTTGGHESAVYELVGTPPLSQVEVAAALGERLGRPVRSVQQPLSEWEAAARAAGLDGYALDGLRRMFTYYGDFGLSGSPNSLRCLLDRQPTTLASFLERELDAHDG